MSQNQIAATRGLCHDEILRILTSNIDLCHAAFKSYVPFDCNLWSLSPFPQLARLIHFLHLRHAHERTAMKAGKSSTPFLVCC